MTPPAESLLLILDLDETLIYASETALGRAPDFRTSLYAVYVRPHAYAFIESVLERYRVAVWSSSMRGYGERVIRNLFPEETTLEFAWFQERCTTAFNPEYQQYHYVKDLRKVRRRGFDLDRVLVVDDTPEKHVRNYGNLVPVTPYFGEEDDDELLLLLEYLRTIESHPALRSLEKRGWRASITGESRE